MTRLVHHPAPVTIGRYLDHVGQLLRDEIRHEPKKGDACRCITCVARILAAVGWPAAVIGDGRGGGGELTSVEAAADGDAPFADLDATLAKALRVLHYSARRVEDLIAEIRKHGNDSEQVAGMGHCLRCERFCNPRANQNDRLRSGLCPACDIACRRWRRLHPHATRSDFIHATKPTNQNGDHAVGESTA